MTLRRIYDLLLRLYPTEYRALFGAEMSAVFDKTTRDRRRQGRIATAGRFLVEMTGLGLAAAREWIAKLEYSVSHSVNYIDGRCLPDPLLMRPPGVSWLQHYGREAIALAGQPGDSHYGWGRGGPAGQPGDPGGPCLNAYQTFALASPLRRLVILTFGSRGCRHCW
jgi:hypothetical protein